MKNYLISIKDYINSWFPSILFYWDVEQKFKVIGWTCISSIYIIGIILGTMVFNRGKVQLNYHDWYDINLPRLDVIQDALTYKMLPLHVECDGCLHNFTKRFFILPDVITTPQMLMLYFMDLHKFVYFDLLLHYTLGTLSLLYLKKKFKLSLITYSIMFFLFNFNGYIVSHYAVGHFTWGGYFLFPYFFILIFQLLEKKGANWLWVAKMSFLSFYIILAGGQHHFVWMMLFLVFLAFSRIDYFKWILIAILFSGFLSAIRLLPPVLGFADFRWFEFISGYPSLHSFFSALTVIQPVDYSAVELTPFSLPPWEVRYFIGLVGVVFLLYFGIWRWLNNYKTPHFSGLFFPMATMLLLTQGSVYKFTLFYVPLLSSERVPTRMASIPITLLIIIGAFYLQEFMNSQKNNATHWVILFSFLLMVNDLFSNLLIWEVYVVSQSFAQFKLNFSGNSIINFLDPLYTLVLWSGLLLTVATMLILSGLVLHETRSQKNIQ